MVPGINWQLRALKLYTRVVCVDFFAACVYGREIKVLPLHL